MGNCCKPYADQVDSEGDSREGLVMYDGGNRRERLASDGNSRERSSSLASSELRVERRIMLNRGEGSIRRDQTDSSGRQLLRNNQSSSSMPMHADFYENKRGRMELVFRAQHPGSGRIPRARQGEQVVAGWPAWLTEVAGEAIKGWIPRRLDSFENLIKVCSISLFFYLALCTD